MTKATFSSMKVMVLKRQPNTDSATANTELAQPNTDLGQANNLITKSK